MVKRGFEALILDRVDAVDAGVVDEHVDRIAHLPEDFGHRRVVVYVQREDRYRELCLGGDLLEVTGARVPHGGDHLVSSARQQQRSVVADSLARSGDQDLRHGRRLLPFPRASTVRVSASA